MKGTWLLIFFILSKLAYGEAYSGFLKEYILEKSSTTDLVSQGNGFEYAVSENFLLLNIRKNTDTITIYDKNIFNKSLSFSVKNFIPEWRITSDYLEKSGSYDILHNNVSFPECRLGNVCKKNKSFSVKFPNKTDPQKIRFYINKKDVTSLFYYDEKNKEYRIKEFYEDKFFDYFKTDIAIFRWKFNEGKNFNGSAKIFIGKNNITGRIVNKDGKFPPELFERKVYFHYPGSETIAPHVLSSSVNREGFYSVDGLPTLDYKVTLDVFPKISPNILEFTANKDEKLLLLSHSIPNVDIIVPFFENKVGRGDFFILSMVNYGVVDSIDLLEQVSGDSVFFQINGNKITFLLPEEYFLNEEIVFYGKSRDISFLIIIPVKADTPEEYVQFGFFNPEGEYAKTSIKGIKNNIFKSDSNLNISVDSLYDIKQDNVKIHYYYRNGRAADITPYFRWDLSDQSLSIHDLDKLKNIFASEGVIAGTFCRTGDLICYRIKREIRLATGDIEVIFDIPLSDGDYYIVLKELELREKPLVKIIKVDGSVGNIFHDIPSGKYQVLFADMSNQIYGDAFIDYKGGWASVKLALKASSDETPFSLKTSGRVVKLSENPLILHQNDFEMINLPELHPIFLDNVKSVSILGSLPAEYKLYSDGYFLIQTGEDPRSSHATIEFEFEGEVKYLLPVYYLGNDYIMVKEKGADYTMCPLERPYCINAFLQLYGVEQGIYNGKWPLSMVLPFDFSKNNVSVAMDSDIDVTSMFTITPSKRSVTLKNTYVPAFLSSIAATNQPFVLRSNDKEYYISLVPGYKSIEVTLIDEDGAPLKEIPGLQAKISCMYGSLGYYSKIEDVVGSKVTFLELPDCNYSLEVLDKQRIYSGYIDNLSVVVGQNILRAVVSVYSKKDAYIATIPELFLPVLKDHIDSPAIFLLVTPENVPKDAAITVIPNKNIKVLNLGNFIMIYDYSDSYVERTIYIKYYDKKFKHKYTVDSIERHLIFEKGSSSKLIGMEGINNDFTYNGSLLKLYFENYVNSNEGYSIFLKTNDNYINITKDFEQSLSEGWLVLKDDKIADFQDALDYGKNTLVIENGHDYFLEVNIYSGAGDIMGSVIIDKSIPSGSVKDLKAILKSSNGSYYSKVYGIKDGKFVFREVPVGIYDLTVFDLNLGLVGSQEIELSDPRTEIYLEIYAVSLK